MRPHRPAPRTIASSGPLIAAASSNGVAIFTGYDLRHGESRSGLVTIANAGHLAGRLELTEAEASSDFAATDLVLSIDDVTDDDDHLRVFEGEIGGLPVGGVDLGRFEPGQLRRYRFLAKLLRGLPDRNRGRGAGAVYEWNLAPALCPQSGGR